MKTDIRRLAEVLRDLKRLRVVCLHGDDAEAIRSSARRLVAAEAGSADDPFRVSDCDGDSREAVAAALGSPSLAGGRSVVWVRHANERLLPAVERALQEQNGPILILEYGASAGRSRLRTLVETSAGGCVIACYVQAEGTRAAVRAALDQFGVTATADVVARLAAQADGVECPGALAGLSAALFAGPGGRLDLAETHELVGDPGMDGLDAALAAGLAGDPVAIDGGLSAALGEGTGGIGVLRAALVHLQRLRAMAMQVADGRTVAEAGRTLRPPLFFRQEKAAAAVLRAWTAGQLGAAARAIWEAERASKATGVPQEALCREALGGLGRRNAPGRLR